MTNSSKFETQREENIARGSIARRVSSPVGTEAIER